MKLFLLFFIAWVPAFAAVTGDSKQSFTYDFNQSAQNQTLPAWIGGPPVASPASHASVSFSISPMAGQADLAVTLVFTETMGGFLRAYWAGTGSNASTMLSDNLFEGIAMANQRTLLIKRSTLSSTGVLTFQSSESTLGVSRIQFEWVDPGTVSLAAPAAQTALINGSGGVLKEAEVDGAPPLPAQDQIRRTVVTAPILDGPARIETGVEFAATLQAAPAYARLEVQISGVLLDQTMQLSLNGNVVGDLAIDTPDLSDPGYQAGTGTTPTYAGWRKGVIYLPADQLKTGEDVFEFTVKGVAPSPNADPIAIKNALLQLKYSAQSSTPVSSGTQAAALTTPVPSPSPTP